MSVGSQLCTQCGLCCTGALHDRANAEPDEIDFLRSRGMQVITGEKPGFALPCPHLRGARCGIYEDRPHVCSSYKCQLLQNVEKGKVNLAAASLKVREARRLYQKVLEMIPPGMSLPQARALPRDPQRAPEGIEADRYPVVVLQVLALMRYIDQHFRHSDEGPLLLEEVLTMGGSKQRVEEESQQYV